MVKYLKIFIIILIIMLFAGCSTVEPWERESLSSPIMIFDKNPIEKGIKIHHIEFREGSSGATGSQSGGCGCG